MEKLINYKSDNINKLSIYLGSKKDSVLFKKNVNSNFYSKKKSEFFSKYKSRTYKSTIYRFNNNFYNHTLKKHYIVYNEKKIFDKRDNLLIISYKEIEKPFSDFSCQKNYHILEDFVTEFKINDEIILLFNENKKIKGIKLDIIINHNIDNTLNKIREILENLSIDSTYN